MATDESLDRMHDSLIKTALSEKFSGMDLIVFLMTELATAGTICHLSDDLFDGVLAETMRIFKRAKKERNATTEHERTEP